MAYSRIRFEIQNSATMTLVQPFIRTMILKHSDTQNLKHSDSAFDADDRESVVVLSASLLLMFLPL